MKGNGNKRNYFICIIILFFSSTLFAENRTGKVVHIEDFKPSINSFVNMYRYVYLDSNDDRIVDAIISYIVDPIALGGFPGILFPAYIKIGSTIIYNYDNNNVSQGVFLDLEGSSIISIDGIAVDTMFTP